MPVSETCIFNPDNPRGNMYFRGEWEYCPEYKTGDVVTHEGILYLAIKYNAGKDPDETANREYWREIVSNKPPEPPEGTGRRVIDGGYSSTESKDKYEDVPLSMEIDGGSANDRVHVSLI